MYETAVAFERPIVKTGKACTPHSHVLEVGEVDS